MGWFQNIGWVTDGPPTHVDGIRSLALVGTGASARVISTTGWHGGLIVRDAATLAPLEQRSLTRPQGTMGTPALSVIELGGREGLVLHGLGADARLWWTDQPGDLLTATSRLDFGGQTLTAMASLALQGGGDALYTTSLQSGAITRWLRDPSGTLHQIEVITVPSGTTTAPPVPPLASGAEIVAPIVLTTGSGNWLISAETRGASVALWQLDADGAATPAGRLTAAEGLAVSRPSQLAAARIEGRDFILLGSAGSGSLTVIELTSDGDLVIRDQVNDDLDTRFAGLSVLTTITVDGRVLVLAGGADDGLTLMSLLPSGRLVHHETIVDTDTLTLNNPLALTAHVAAGQILIDVVGEGELGQSRLAIPLTTLGNVLQAGDTGETLAGGPGGDILIDGAGSDVLSGGPGADIFVFGLDGELDTILDFTPGEDRIDISAWGRIRDISALGFRTINGGGIEISHGDERLQVFPSDGRPLKAADFTAGNLLGLDHIPLIPATPWQPVIGPAWPLLPHLPGPGRLFLGTSGDDTIAGTSGDDVIFGGGGRNRLSGGAGDDLLFGEAAHEPFDSVAGQVVRLYQTVLGRAPEAAGFTDWSGRLLGPGDDDLLEQVARGFVNSPEFQALAAPGSAGFVSQLLHNITGTTPDTATIAAGVAQLAAGMSREEFTLDLIRDPDLGRSVIETAFHHSAAGLQAAASDTGYALLRAILGREPEPEEFESATFALALGSSAGEVASDLIAGGGTQLRIARGSNPEFVTELYQTLLGRAPDDQGLADWVSRLRAGVSRAEVVAGVAGSIEFTTILAPDLKAWMQAHGPDDRLEGGTGDNILAGGLWADTFVFAQKDGGAQRVLDLEPWDLIELQGFGYGSAAEALGHVSQQGADAVFADQGVMITFHHTDHLTLSEDMFLFT